MNQFPVLWGCLCWYRWLLQLRVLGLLCAPLPALKAVVVFIPQKKRESVQKGLKEYG